MDFVAGSSVWGHAKGLGPHTVSGCINYQLSTLMLVFGVQVTNTMF